MGNQKLKTDKKLKLMQKVSGIADELALGYVERLRKSINDPDSEQKSITPHEMDRVLRVAKQYSDRVLLAEGKATENLGVGGMPFNVIITKTYETPATEDTEDSEGTTDETDEQE